MLNNFTATYTDYYQLRMAQTYYLTGQKDAPAIFDYSFRKLPFKGGYAIFAGLADLMIILKSLRFDKKDIEFLKLQGFHSDFIAYLENFRFNGSIYACNEGEIIFPLEPVLVVEANIIEAQIIETVLLNILNFETLIATKASRMVRAAQGRQLIDFGLRRAQGPGGYYASRAAIIGGFSATSNVRAACDYNINPAGTMAHSFIQSYANELKAFEDFALINPDNCVLLIDTYNTLQSGLPNAIKVAKQMEKRGARLKGIRLDSGDLAYLAKVVRKALNENGLDYVKIIASNQLDEYVIKSLLEQDSPIDIFGVGTSLVVGAPDAALDGVYKLACSNNSPRIKLSENFAKISLPYKKQVYRLFDNNQVFLGADVVTLHDEKEAAIMHHPFEPLKSLIIEDYYKEPLLHKIMENGKPIDIQENLSEINSYYNKRFSLLPKEYKRFDNPHLYKIGLSEHLATKRNQLIKLFHG